MKTNILLFLIFLLILTNLSCSKLESKHQEGTGARSLINGAWVLLTRSNKLVSNSPAKCPIFEMNLYTEMGLEPRNTVTFFPNWPTIIMASSTSFEGVWASMYAGSFFAENDGRSHITLSHYIYPIFKAKNNLLEVLKRHENTLKNSDLAETYSLLGLIHYYQFLIFGEMTHNGKIYPANSSLQPSIFYLEQAVNLQALPYKNNKTINDLGVQALLARLYWLNDENQKAREMALEVEQKYAGLTLEKNDILWRISLLGDDNISANTITYTQAVPIFGDQNRWPLAWVAQNREEIFEKIMAFDDISSEPASIVFLAKKNALGTEEKAKSDQVHIQNGFIIITLSEIQELATTQNFDFEFRKNHLFNGLLNRAIAIKTNPQQAKYIPGYLKP